MTLALPASAQQAPPGEVLDRPLRGEAAITAVRDILPEVAALNRTTAAELTALLRRDDTMWLDQSGLLHVKDEELPVAPTGSPEEGPFPNEDTFRLHSKAGAARTIFLDFDGHAVSGTAWNANYGVVTTAQPAFDVDGDSGNWSQAEHDVVQSVYQRVAEDFAPFDVDVTTEDPGEDALHRSSTSDELYGARVLITPSVEASDKICGGGCGGVAYLNVFNRVDNSYYQPAWVFSHVMYGNAKYIAEAASHEAGHNLGLKHDGTSTESYYDGHGNWAPIMGVGYSEPVVQWSRGEYPDANNTQDDFAVMQSYGLPLRGDDHGSTISTATSLDSATSASGVVETRSDKDVFSISRGCSDNATVTLRPAPTSPNLDGKLRLLTSTGAVVAEDDPLSGGTDYDLATGLSAAVTAPLSAGTYYVEVDGVGASDLTTGYSDYASVGAYSLQISACSGSSTTDQESSTSISYNGWRGLTDTAADGGTLRYNTARGSTSTLKFNGTAVTWLTRKGPDQGIATVIIDGVNKGNIDLYAPTTTNHSQAFTGLAAANHTIVVKATGSKNAESTGSSVTIDGYTVGTTTTQDSAAAVKYNTWLGRSSAKASGGQYRLSGSAKATAVYTFSGTAVDWTTTTGPAWGQAQVFIDGVDKGVVDLYSSTTKWQTVKSYSGLASGAHTLTLKVLGTKNAAATSTKVSIDAFTAHE